MSAGPSNSTKTEQTYRSGTAVGPYRLEAFIGSGGMAEVYRARHQTLDKLVAIKFLDAKHTRKPDVLARFLREGRFASKLHHPNVVGVSDVGEHDGVPYLVMEYLEGEPLSTLVEREAPLEPDAAARILIPVAAAVAMGHTKGVIHRDLKPDNIFLAETSVGEMQPKVLDFGISKSMDEDAPASVKKPTAFVGTPGYMSPEQTSGGEPTVHSDQYSLGVVLYELACGRRPFERGQKLSRLLESISAGDFAKPTAHRPELPEPFEALILRAMHLEPEERFPSVLALAHALVEFADERTRTVWDTRLKKQEERAETAAERESDRREITTGGASATTVTRFDTKPTRDDTEGTASQPGRAGGRPWKLMLGVALVALIGGFALWRSRPEQPAAASPSADTSQASPAPSSYQVVVEVVPETAELLLDGERVATGRLDTTVTMDGAAHRLEVRAEGYVAQQFSFRDAPPPTRVELEASAAPPPTASASAAVSADPAVTPPPPPRAPTKAPVPAPPATFSTHPDNVDPWAP